MRARRRLSDRSSGGTTLIASDCTLDGKIRCQGDLMVCGDVTSDANVNGTVTIVESGIWRGHLTARHVIIAGTVEGDIVSNGQIEVCESATIRGTVTGAAIAVGQGAVIDGEIRTLKSDGASEFVENRGQELVDEEAETA